MIDVLAYTVSFIAMTLVASSYFFTKKEWYLLLQSSGIVFLILSYLLTGEYFAMLGLGVGLARTITFFAYEKKDKIAPLWLAVLFAFLTVLAYGIVNLCILQTAKPVDILYLISLVGYAFVFRIREVKTVRFASILPTVLAVAYNVAVGAVPFVIVSYSFELAAIILSIFKYHVLHQENIKGATYEKH